jgi:hypothetical protein
MNARRTSAQGLPQEKPSARPESTPDAPDKAAEKHSTSEDRQRLVTIAHKLEAAPLDPALTPEREWAVGFAVTAPDIHVRICPALIAGLRRPRYKYKAEIGEQLLISSAAFLIEHPAQADNSRAQSVGGIEGMLKAYSAIVKAEPQATAKSLDALLEKQREGKLADAVREIVKGCQEEAVSNQHSVKPGKPAANFANKHEFNQIYSRPSLFLKIPPPKSAFTFDQRNGYVYRDGYSYRGSLAPLGTAENADC